MGRPRVNALLPKYASAFKDRHGKPHIRLRRTGWRTLYVQPAPGTPEFTEAYRSWEKDGKLAIGRKAVKPGSFDDLIARFYTSTVWENLRESTRENYRGQLERFRAVYGSRAADTMSALNVDKLMVKMKDTPVAANNLKKRLAQLFDYAILLKMRKDNPARAVRSLKTKGGGHQTWQEEQIEIFEAKYPVGTMPRLAFDLALYTAQRKADVRLMGPKDVKRGKVHVVQLKTGKGLWIPIHPNLAKSLAEAKTGDEQFIINAYGKPFTYDSFGMWFGKKCRAAGLHGFAMHGLRKAASRRMAEVGLSNQLIKSITGHTSDAEVARYTRDAQQEMMAEVAFAAMSKANQPENDLANLDESTDNA